MIKTLLALSVLASAITFTGCATATPYQPKSLTGGYSDKDLGDGQWKVEFKGNSFLSKEKTEEYTDRRAKEVCGGEYTLEKDDSKCGEAIQVLANCEMQHIIWTVKCSHFESGESAETTAPQVETNPELN